MVNYSCPRCGFSTNHKTKYIMHLRRKFICKKIISDDTLNNEYIKYNILDKICLKLSSTKIHKNPQKNVELHKKPQNSTFFCNYCEKLFSRSDSLSRHLKKCKEKRKDEENKNNLVNLVNLLNEKIENKDKQLEEKNNQIDKLIKKVGINIGTQNIQQNIKILAYDSTDLSHLTNNDYLKCLKHSNFCIPHLIKKIHFNPDKPENHNIYISNLKNNYVMIYNGEKWMINDRDESIQSLIDDKESIIEQKLEEWIENGKNYPDIMKKFNRYLEKKENDTVLNKIKNEIKLMLFNNRDIVIKN